MNKSVNLIKGLKAGNHIAQKKIYDTYAGLFYAIALRYMKDPMLAEDIMIESFYKIFSRIRQFNDTGSFEGWMKRIVVNQALMQIRKYKNLNLHVELDKAYDIGMSATVIDNLNHEEILELIGELPPGYRTVFNMYVIEGYKHREIAEILDISINTSKSQLILAKKKLRELYKKKHLLNDVNYG